MLSKNLRMPALLMAATMLAACGSDDPEPPEPLDPELVKQGREVFRFDTFGDEAQWSDKLHMHEVIESAVDPVTALAVGRKVDS